MASKNISRNLPHLRLFPHDVTTNGPNSTSLNVEEVKRSAKKISHTSSHSLKTWFLQVALSGLTLVSFWLAQMIFHTRLFCFMQSLCLLSEHWVQELDEYDNAIQPITLLPCLKWCTKLSVCQCDRTMRGIVPRRSDCCWTFQTILVALKLLLTFALIFMTSCLLALFCISWTRFAHHGLELTTRTHKQSCSFICVRLFAFVYYWEFFNQYCEIVH